MCSRAAPCRRAVDLVVHRDLRDIIGYYIALYGTTGLLLPFLPVHFLALGFTGSQVATLSSVSPVAMLVVPPLWGYLADRTGRASSLLLIATSGWAMAMALQLGVASFWMALLVMMIQAFFGPSLSALADALAVGAALRTGVPFARIRLWGSIGFIVTSFSFGQALAQGVHPSRVLLAGLTVATIAVLFAALVHRSSPPANGLGRPPSISEAAGLLRQRSLLLFLVMSGFHWASFTPYNLFLTPHLTQVTGTKAFIGPSLALGVGAEVLGMRYFDVLQRRVPLFGLLGLSFALNAGRWWVMTWGESGPLLVLLQVLHGFGFGVFFVGSVAYLERAVPPALRSTGRALFGAVAFGLGGVGGNQLAGWLFDHGGTRGAFRASVFLELIALMLLGVLALSRPREPASCT